MFALEWGDPPFNGGRWVPEMLQVAGGEAPLACPGAPSVRVTWEQIEAAAPQVVMFMPCGYDLRAAVDEASRTLLGRPELAGVEAIIAVDASAFFSRPGWSTAWRSSPRRFIQDGFPATSGHRRAPRAKAPPVKP